MKVALLATSCNRVSETIDVVRENLELLGGIPLIIADCSSANLNWTQVHSLPGSGGINGWIRPECFDSSWEKLRELNPIELIHLDYVTKQTGDSTLIAEGVKAAKRLGFDYIIKISGTHYIRKSPIDLLSKVTGILTQSDHNRKYSETCMFIAHKDSFEILTTPEMCTRSESMLYTENRFYHYGGKQLQDWPNYSLYYGPQMKQRPMDWSSVHDQLPMVLHYLEHMSGGDFRSDCTWMRDLVMNGQPNNILELGVRDGNSTLCILMGLKQSGNSAPMVSVDIESCDNAILRVQTLGIANNWKFVCMDDREFTKQYQIPTDFIFLDTSHTHEHTLWELENYAPLLTQNGVMVCHDTKSCPDGVKKAIDKFVIQYPDFTVSYRDSQCGMGIISRI